jgi:hypothetical protein
MISTVLGQVVLGELLSYFIGRYADNRVLTRVEIRWKVKEFHPDQAFFERAARPADRVLDDVLEELTASLAVAKRNAPQQAIQLRPNGPLG